MRSLYKFLYEQYAIPYIMKINVWIESLFFLSNGFCLPNSVYVAILAIVCIIWNFKILLSLLKIIL